MQHLERGNLFFWDEEYESAIREFQLSIESNVESVELYCNLSFAHYEMANYEEALKRGFDAINCDPQSLESLKPIGIAIRGIYWQSQSDSKDYSKTPSLIRTQLNTVPLEHIHRLLRCFVQNNRNDCYIHAIHCINVHLLDTHDENCTLSDLEKSILQMVELDERMAFFTKYTKFYPYDYHLKSRFSNFLAQIKLYHHAQRLNREVIEHNGWTLPTKLNLKFTHNWASHNFPNYTKLLEFNPKYDNFNALEIGFHEGLSSLWLLDNWIISRNGTMDCIDIHDSLNFSFNVKKMKAEEYINKYIGPSSEVVPTLNDNYYDLIIIDGNHTYEDARLDIDLSWEKLRPGGIFIIDDYNLDLWPGVVKATDEALESRSVEIEILKANSQAIWRKKAK